MGCSPPPPSTRVCSHALCPARCVHCRRAPPLASRSRSAPLQPAPHRVSRACNPRQHAYAFNQPLSWDTSGVTNMQSMFDVRPNPHPQIHIPAHLVYLLQSAESRPVPRTLRVHTAGARARLPPSAAYSSPRTARPACDPWQGATAFNQPLSWDTSGVTNMVGMFYVRLTALCHEPAQSRLHTACTAIARPCTRGRRGSPLIPQTSSLRLGRTLTPCPRPTSCSSAARGRAPPPLPPLAMARPGRREAAPEAITPRCACGRGRVHGGCPYHSPQHVRGVHTYTDVRELGKETDY